MNHKPTDAEIAEIKAAVLSDAWPVFEKLLNIAAENAQMRYNLTLSDHRYYQGILHGIRQIMEGFKGYKDLASEKESKEGVAGGRDGL